MNLGSVWKLPVIFVCENNHYAESTLVEYALSIENVADRGPAYNMPGLLVDGMVLFAVYEGRGPGRGAGTLRTGTKSSGV